MLRAAHSSKPQGCVFKAPEADSMGSVSQGNQWAESTGPRGVDEPRMEGTPEALSDYPFGPALPGTGETFSGPDMPRTVHWSIPWADLMMTMFILFAVLFAYHGAGGEKQWNRSLQGHSNPAVGMEPIVETPSQPREVPERIADLYERSRKTLKAEALQDLASVDFIKDRAVRIVLTGDVLFDTGEADLKRDAVDSLKKVCGVIGKTHCVINVVGHTDNVPIHTDRFSSNWELSAARACRTARFLIEEMGILPAQIYVSGYSHYNPVGANSTPEGRKANRRVEIIISKEKPTGVPGVLEKL